MVGDFHILLINYFNQQELKWYFQMDWKQNLRLRLSQAILIFLPALVSLRTGYIYIVGHDSCCYCDEHGETVKTGPRGHVMSFPFRNTASGYTKPRTAGAVTANSFEALKKIQL